MELDCFLLYIYKEPGEASLRHQSHIAPTYAHAYYQYFLLPGLQSTSRTR